MQEDEEGRRLKAEQDERINRRIAERMEEELGGTDTPQGAAEESAREEPAPPGPLGPGEWRGKGEKEEKRVGGSGRAGGKSHLLSAPPHLGPLLQPF